MKISDLKQGFSLFLIKLYSLSLIIYSTIFLGEILVKACPYNSNSEAFISDEYPLQESIINIPILGDNQFNSIGFGFWSQCQPLFEPKNYPNVDQQFVESLPEDGQLLMTVYGTSYMILLFAQFDGKNLQIVHKIFLFDSYNVQELDFNFPAIEYESQWIYTFITIQKVKTKQIQLKVELTQQNLQTRYLDIHENTQQWVLLGGRGHLLGWFNLNIFRGHLTKLYINQGYNWNYNTFAQMADFCSIPTLQEGQLLLNNDQLTNFDGTFLIQNSINQVGNNYYLSGWIKLDLSQIIDSTTFTIIRITAFKNFQDGQNDGDELFLMQVQCDVENQMNTQIILQADMHKIPLKGQIGQYSTRTFKTIRDNTSNQIYQGLMNWFFIQYEYGRKTSNKYGLFSIQFFNKPQLIQLDVGDSTYGGSFRNIKFYFFVGGDEYNTNFIIAQTFHLKFTYNYMNDRDQLEISCHYSCLTCNGPLFNNCLTCQSEQNRIYSEDQNVCQCQEGKIEDNSTKLCIPFDSFFSNVEKTETKYDQLLCPFGYFLLPNTNNKFSCLQCPQQYNDGLLCMECYFYPLTWYKDPHCRYDFISIRNKQTDALTPTERDPNFYDQYVIDEFDVLLLKVGVQYICYGACYQSSITHLKQPIAVSCKRNFVYQNGECVASSIENCQLAYTQNYCYYCIDGMEIIDNKCVPCGNHCLLCNYMGLGLCLQCEKDYQLINNQCIKCGSNCKTCRLVNDFNISKTYLKCLQCKENSKYFISFDGINCLENTIQNCKYAFQSLKSNMKQNTLDQYFIPQFDYDKIETHCAKCKTNYIYIFESKVCQKGTYFSCQFGYAQKFTDYNPNNPIQYSVTDETYLFSTSQQFCLINWYYDPNVLQFSQFCSSLISYCAICIIKKNHYQWDCLTCLTGYYSERQSGRCRPCPPELKCLQCYQEQTLQRDSWKQQIRAFYKQFIDIDNDHPFIEYGQSLNSEDYQIQCKLCQDGYDLYEQNCIQSCPKNCAQCSIINSKNICIRCFQTEKGVQLTLQDNQCLDCPDNCSLCRQRTQEELSSINPIFNTTFSELEKYSYQCLKSFKDKEYFYDSQIGHFISCQEATQGCEKQYNMNFNLYCSSDEFTNELYGMNDQEIDQFLQHNLFIHQLSLPYAFEKLNTYNFYKMANYESIKVINIFITSKKQQNCQIQKEILFNQQFSQQIFSAINVSLTIDGQGKTIFEFHESIAFYNFSQITLDGLIIESISNSINSEIIFHSLFQQKIALKNIEFRQNSQQIAMLRININQVYDLEIKNFIFNGVNQNNNHSIVYIQSTNYSKTLQFQNIQLINSQFTNQSVFLIDVGNEDKIQFTNFSISYCTFRNSNLIKLRQEQVKSSLILQDFKFKKISILKTFSFIDIAVLDFTYIDQMNFINSTIIDSIILLINQNIQILDLVIQQNNFQNESIGILNSQNDNMKQDQNFLIQNLKIIGNKYSIDTRYILLMKNINLSSNLQMTNLQISNNQISNTSQSYNQISINSSLINIQVNDIVIKDSTLYKGYGINLICIFNAKTVKIANLQISQDEHFLFKTFYSSMDCLYKHIPGELFTISLVMFSVQNLEMQNIIIQNAILINSPIIYYKSEDTMKSVEQENFSFHNVTIYNNILLLTNPQIRSSIIFIQSTQNITVQFRSVTVQMNILQEYQQDSSFETALTLNLDMPFGYVQLLSSSFLENQIFNTSSSLIYIRSSKLNIINCNFESNNLFSFERIKNNLFWPFDMITEVYLEDIINQFSIKSLSGNGKFEVEQFSLIQCNITNSFGSNGAGFYLIANKFSQFRIENIKLYSLNTYFEQTGEQGGAFFIDGSEALQVNILFQNLQINNLSSRSQGGFVYMKIGAVKSLINFKDIMVQNVFALFGSFIYIEFLKNINEQQEVQVDRIIINQDYTGWKMFLNKFKKISVSEKNSLIIDRSLIQIESASKVYLAVIFFYNIQYEQAIVLDNINNIVFERIYLTDCSAIQNMIVILPSLYSKFYLAIEQVFAKNISFGRIQIHQNDNCFEDETYISNDKQWLCQISTHLAPSELNYKNLESFSTANCLIQQMADEIAMNKLGGLFLLKSNSNSNKLKMRNIFLTNIECSTCQNGLIFFSISGSEQLLSIAALQIQNCKCGSLGCLVTENQLQSTRILNGQDQLIMKQQLNLSISNYICKSNIATNGTCLYLIKSKAVIQNSIFTNNTANVAGGAICIKDSQQVFIIKSIIEGNYATYGGGIYLQDLQQLLYQKLSTLIYQNTAGEFSDQISTIPSNLKVSLGLNNSLQLMTDVYQNQTMLTETKYLSSETYAYGIYSKSVLLPNGQKISDYKIFDWKKQSYRQLNLQLRIKAYDVSGNQIKGLKNSYCELRQRIYNVKNSDSNENFSDAIKIYFNETTQDYNLDDQIFYFDDNQPANLFLQLQFFCNKVEVPKYDEKFPYEITSLHNNYYLRLNVRSFPCQLGEIKNTSISFCQICDSGMGLYSLKLNQTKCQIKDDISTISVTPVSLQLRAGYWRPFFSSIQIVECYNFLQNCLGGWTEGSASCYQGHIGALCEQCDIYNIRGDGHFAIYSKFKCGSCVDKWKNMTLIVFISIWTILSITISVQGTIRSLQENAKKSSLRFINLTSITRTVQSAILIKMLTNYFQIISSVTSFRLDISITLQSIISAAGSPIQPLLYSLDCFLIDMFKFEILYAKIVWQLIMPVIYINIFFLFYMVVLKLQFMEFNKSSITTSIIYVYIYFQPNLVGELIGLISFRDISDHLWVSSNVAYTYNTQQHFQWMLKFCLPLIIILAITIPLLLFFGLVKNKKKFTEKNTKLFWGYLYNEYTEQAFFWEILKIVTKELIIIALTFYDDFIVLKAMIIQFILLIYLKFNQQFQPYKNIKLNALDYQSIYVCLITFSLAIGCFITQQQNILQVNTIQIILIVISNAHLLLVFLKTIIGEIAFETNQKYQKQLDEIRIYLRKKFPFIDKYQCLRKYFQSQQEKQQKVYQNFKKLKEFALPQVKGILKLKNQGTNNNSKSSQPTFINFKSLENIYIKSETKERAQKQQISASIVLKGEVSERLPFNAEVFSNIREIKEESIQNI